MPSIKKILFLAAVSQIALVIAAPIPQLAGEGAACNSLLSSTDNGVGYGVEGAEDNTAAKIRGAKGAKVGARQLAGEGAACNSILSSTDNGVGYGIEGAEDNTAALLRGKTGAGAATGTTTGSGSTSGGKTAPAPAPAKADPKPAPAPAKGGPAPKGPKAKRQGDKIANGAANIIDALDQPQLADIVKTQGNTLDGQLTSDAASIGAQVGAYEESTLIKAGKSIPRRVKRQGDKIANGAANVLSALGQDQVADIEQSTGDNLDGQLTGDAADAGAQLGSYEESTLIDAGSKVAQ